MHAARYLALRCLSDQAVWVGPYLGLGVLLAPSFSEGGVPISLLDVPIPYHDCAML